MTGIMKNKLHWFPSDLRSEYETMVLAYLRGLPSYLANEIPYTDIFRSTRIVHVNKILRFLITQLLFHLD